MRDRKVIVIARRRAGARGKRLAESNGGREKDEVVPDAWGRMAEARNCRLPTDARSIAFIPNRRRITVRRGACREWSAPLRPVIQRLAVPVVGKRQWRPKHGNGRQTKSSQGQHARPLHEI